MHLSALPNVLHPGKGAKNLFSPFFFSFLMSLQHLSKSLLRVRLGLAFSFSLHFPVR